MSVIIWHICELWMMKIRHFCVIFRRKKDDGKKVLVIGAFVLFLHLFRLDLPHAMKRGI